MSIRRMYYMACDICLEIADHSDEDSPRAVRELMKHDGWARTPVPGYGKRNRWLDVCPKCQADPSRGASE